MIQKSMVFFPYLKAYLWPVSLLNAENNNKSHLIKQFNQRAANVRCHVLPWQPSLETHPACLNKADNVINLGLIMILIFMNLLFSS